MENKLADILRMTAANMAELMNRLADHVEQLEFKITQLEKQPQDKDNKNA